MLLRREWPFLAYQAGKPGNEVLNGAKRTRSKGFDKKRYTPMPGADDPCIK